VLAGLFGAVALGFVMLWPHDVPSLPRDNSVRQINGTVLSIHESPCDQSESGPGPTPDETTMPCGTAEVSLTTAATRDDVVTTPLPRAAGAPKVEVGDKVVLTLSAGNPQESRYAIVDHQRGRQLWMLLGAFILAVVAFGRWRGLASLFGLAITFLVLLGFVVPAILGGEPPLPVAVVGCGAIALTVLFMTHGISRPTTVAVAGTLVSLVLTGLLSLLAVRITQLTGSTDESSFLLGQQHGVDLRGLLLAGIMIGSLGVLDDVTVTQAETVKELALANPDYGPRRLYAAATRIGRAHIASVINTIVLAYAGASLPLLVLIVALRDPVGQVLSDQMVATELVRSAVGTIGLVAAVPITTALAAWLSPRRLDRVARSEASGSNTAIE
jgi:uncharacterized membrane protein